MSDGHHSLCVESESKYDYFQPHKEMFLVDTDRSAELGAQYWEFIYIYGELMLEMFIFRLFKVYFLRTF